MRKTILVIEDDFDAGNAIGMMLLQEGYNVVIVDDVEPVSDALVRHQPDLVITDYQLLRGKTGVDVANVLKKTGYPGAVILVSGIARNLSHEIRARFNAAFDKPLNFDEFLHTVKLLTS